MTEHLTFHYSLPLQKTWQVVKAIQKFSCLLQMFESTLGEIVCLFVVSSFSPHSRIFHSFGDVTIAGEGLQRRSAMFSENRPNVTFEQKMFQNV